MLQPRPPEDVEKLTKLPMELQDTPGFEKDTMLLPKLEPGLVLSPVEGSSLLVLSFDNQPAHPADPLCFSFPVKAWTTLLAALLVMGTALSSSAPSGASPFIPFGGNSALVLSLFLLGYVAGPFIGAPLSEAYGRRPVFIWGGLAFLIFTGGCAGAQSLGSLLVLRFFAGFFGSVPTTNGAVCGDVWNAKERGTAMSFYSVATFAGPALGPTIGSFASIRWNWRACFIILTIVQFVTFLLTVFACRETYAPIILSRLAAKLRTELGDERIVSRLELEERASRGTPRAERLKRELVRVLRTPFVMLFTESIVACITAHMSLCYALIYLLFEAYPIIFSEVRDLQPGYSSLPFLSTLVGAIVSVPVTLYFQRLYVREMKAKGGHQPEMRLLPAQWGGVLTVISFLWLGWSGYKPSTPWIVPALSGVPQGIASVCIFRSLQTYMIDTYERNAASAIAANVVVRSLAGAIFPIFARSMFKKLGVQWACTLLAGLMLLLVPVPFIFDRYGPRIRKNSRFAPGR